MKSNKIYKSKKKIRKSGKHKPRTSRKSRKSRKSKKYINKILKGGTIYYNVKSDEWVPKETYDEITFKYNTAEALLLNKLGVKVDRNKGLNMDGDRPTPKNTKKFNLPKFYKNVNQTIYGFDKPFVYYIYNLNSETLQKINELLDDILDKRDTKNKAQTNKHSNKHKGHVHYFKVLEDIRKIIISERSSDLINENILQTKVIERFKEEGEKKKQRRTQAANDFAERIGEWLASARVNVQFNHSMDM